MDEIFPYQAEGAEWLCSRSRAGLHDEAGLGKTWTTIRALDRLGARRGLIICRAMLRQEWIDEHAKRALVPRRLVKGMSEHDFMAWQRGRFDVLLLSYEMAAKYAKEFATLGEILDFVVIDEAHFLRNPISNRTKFILGEDSNGRGGIIQWAERTFHLTGTPLVRDPLDYFTFLRFAGAIDMPKYAFMRYFYPDGEPWHEEELREIYGRVALRRTLEGVGIQLPEIFYTPLTIEGDAREVERYFKDHPGLDKAILAALEKGNLKFIEAGHMMTIRRLCGEAKALPFASYLVEALKAGEYDKVVVMGTHFAALETIHTKLRAAGLRGYLVNGKTRENERVEARKNFQNNAGVQYFIGNSGAAGTGITLHAACHLFVFESEWNPGDNEQMIKRIRRIGQKRQQHARFVTLAGSFDEEINSIVINKTRKIAQVQGPNGVTLPLVANL